MSTGRVNFFRNSVRDSIGHPGGPLKLLSLPHVPGMLRNSVLSHSERDGKDTLNNFAHRRTFEGEHYIARLTVRGDRNGMRFYDNEFSDIQKENGDALPNGSVPTPRAGQLTHPRSMTANILRGIMAVNPADVSKAVDENGEPLVVYRHRRDPKNRNKKKSHPFKYISQAGRLCYFARPYGS
jgi:hypothetical protein